MLENDSRAQAAISRGPGFAYQYSHDSLQLSASLVPEYLTFTSGYEAHTWCTNTHVSKHTHTYKIKMKKIKLQKD